MVDDLVSEMIQAQSSKSPLQQEILTGLSIHDRLYVFEGQDDYAVYDEWMKRNKLYSKSGHLTANGKKQVISLYQHALETNNQDIISNCFFFVDHDYDQEAHNTDNFTTLNCYSIENYIVNYDSVLSYLKDEFRLDASKNELKEELLSTFEKDFAQFNKIARELCKPLFINYNIGDESKFYKKITKLIDINYGSVEIKGNASILNIAEYADEDEINRLSSIYDSLSNERAIRGKYVFEFIKTWLASAKNHLSSIKNHKVTKDPLQIQYRRMASAAPIPQEINKYA
ncbi:MAG: DUF4435 domain-containing protein [Plesiomonas shigelloides]